MGLFDKKPKQIEKKKVGIKTSKPAVAAPIPKQTIKKVMNDVGEVSTWRDTILPAAFEIEKFKVNLGDIMVKVYSIFNYPSTVPIGWLRNLIILPNTMVNIITEPGNKEELLKSIDFNVREAMVKQAAAEEKASASEFTEATDAINKASELSQRIQAENANVSHITIYIAVYAKNEGDLIKLCKEVEGRLSGNRFIARAIPNLQEEGFNSFYPICSNPYKEMTGLSMPSDVFYAGLSMFPQNGINDSDGMFLGNDEFGNPIFINLWAKTYGKQNMNMAVMGRSGAGKSATCKTMITHELSQNRKVIILDPEEEYVSFARYFEGNIVDATSQRINPLQLRDIPETWDDMDDKALADFIASKRSAVKASSLFGDLDGLDTSNNYQGPLSLHITFLKQWFKLYQPELSDAHLSLIEKLLYETYASFGIDEFSDPRQMKNEDFPILSDLYRILQKHLEQEKQNKEDTSLKTLYGEIAIYLQSAVSGSDKFMFNGPTTFDLSNKFTVFNIHRLINSPQSIKNAQFYNITSFVWLELTRNKNEETILQIDEAHLLINEDSQTTFKFLGDLSKRARKYNAALWVTTQNIGDFLHPSVSRYGEGILSNCATKFLMKSDGSDLQKLAGIFELNDSEQTVIRQADRGQGLLMAGDMRLFASIEIEKTLVLPLCNLGGGK